MAVPTLQSNSARAHTTAESRFRIDYPLASARGVRVIALDPDAEKVVKNVSRLNWHSAAFFSANTTWDESSFEGGPANVELRGLDQKTTVSLGETLDGVDSTIMVATTDTGTEAAATIGAACAVRGITTAGIVFGQDTLSTVSALRPYARVLIISADEHDLEAILTAMRA